MLENLGGFAIRFKLISTTSTSRERGCLNQPQGKLSSVSGTGQTIKFTDSIVKPIALHGCQVPTQEIAKDADLF